MDEIASLAKAAPQSAIIGALVYQMLATRRLEKRIEDVADKIGCPPRKRTPRRVLGVLCTLAMAGCLMGCMVTRKCTKAGCTTSVGPATNAVPILRQMKSWLPFN